MFSFIQGTLISYSPSHAIIQTGGIGYRLAIPASAFRNLPQMGETIFLHTSLVIRENAQTLYGFLTAEERDLFETLILVSGIGPKIALSLIGHLPLEDFRTAIMQNNVLAISKVPGIGKKTTERLIIEMKDKLPALFPSHSSSKNSPISDLRSQKLQDALNALIHLGYSTAKAEKAIQKTINHKDLEQIDLATLITQSLKHV